MGITQKCWAAILETKQSSRILLTTHLMVSGHHDPPNQPKKSHIVIQKPIKKVVKIHVNDHIIPHPKIHLQ